MSLDESRPFMAMTMKIPIDGIGNSSGSTGDGIRYDFMQKVREGIEGALSRNDNETLSMLESAMSVMQRQQDSVVSVSFRV